MQNSLGHDGKIPPHSIEVERIVLGTLMTERGAFDEVREILTEDCFYEPFHKSIFRTIENIVHRGDRADAITVYNDMKRVGDCDIVELMDIAGHNTFDVYQHAAILFDKSKRRKFIEIGGFLMSNGFSEAEDIVDILSQANTLLDGLFDGAENHTERIDAVIGKVIEQINENCKSDGAMTGTPIGFHDFDRKAGGLQKSDLVIIAGETSQGKTSVALSMLTNAALYGAKVAVYSLEMKNTQLVARMMSSVSGIPSTSILYKSFDEHQFNQLDCSIGGISKSLVYFDDRGTSNIDTIICSIRSMKKKYDIEGVMIDYLQILNVNMKGSNTEQQMGDVARRLKNLAKELDIWVIALSQLSRDANSPEPSMNRLRASGQIAEAADIVCLVYRPEVYGRRFPEPFTDRETKGAAMLNFTKGRNIGTLKMLCGFDEVTTRFYDLSIPASSAPSDPNSVPF